MDKQTPRGRRQRPLRRPETGIGRPLPAPAGHDCQAGRSAVPPRGVQPVPVESVLDRARMLVWGRGSAPSQSSAARPLFASLHPKGSSCHAPFGDYGAWLLLAIIVLSDGTHTF